MKRLLALSLACLVFAGGVSDSLAASLRVFIRGGQANRGQDVHAHPRFLGEWTKLLGDRGMTVDGGMEFPTSEQLAKTDVLVMYAQEGGDVPADRRAAFENYLKRGGGIVVLHTASVPPKTTADGAAYWKSVIGGSWVWGQTKWLEGPMALYYVDRTHPVTTGVANFDLDDEIYYDFDLDPNIRVLAGAYTPNTSSARKNDQRGQPKAGKITVYDIAPQMWTFENQRVGGKPYRAFVSIPGHRYDTFQMPHYRAVLLRGIAWAGKRKNVDEFNTKEDLATLLYPKGGPSSPADSLTQLSVHPDFKVSLVAAEPLINKPMNIDWDAQGRLWVAETPEYPDGRDVNPGTDYVQRWQKDDKLKDNGALYDRPAYDRISILTDTNGDGVMDKKHIFADHAHGVPGGLERVTSFVFFKDGVIVAAAPDIWFLRDTNGDDVCDKAEKLYTNLGYRDTHAVLNNLRMGFDGWVYGTHGYSATPNAMSGDGSKKFGAIGSGVVRFKPDGSMIEQHSSKGGNTWGLQITWDNEVFWTQPTSGDLLMHVVMSENNLSQSGQLGLTSFNIVSKSIDTFSAIPYDTLPYVQIDQVGRFTAAAGTVIYDGGSWPAKWNYSYMTTEPTINIIHHQFVQPNGVTYASSRQEGREQTEFIQGKDAWFRPIENRVGPDGAVYVVDFYNQAVIHNDTRGPKHGPRNAAIRPDRDHYYGRILRVDHKDAKQLAPVNLSKASSAELVRALEHPNRHVRLNAVGKLAESPKADATAPLRALVISKKSPEARVAALWALARTGGLDSGTVAAAAIDSNAAVRKNAMLAAAAAKADAKASALKLASDTDARVQLNALVALSSMELNAADASALVAIYPKLTDKWAQAALLAAANRAPAVFLDAALASSDAGVAPLISQLTRTLVSGKDATQGAKLAIALSGNKTAKPEVKKSMLTSLAGAPVPKWSGELQSALRLMLNDSDARVAAAAVPLIAKWDKSGTLAADVKRKVSELTKAVADRGVSDEDRADIARVLLASTPAGSEGFNAVFAVLGGDASPALQISVIEAIGELTAPEPGAPLAAALPKLSGPVQDAALNQLFKRVPWSLALLDGLDAGTVPPSVLSPVNIQRLRLHPNAKVSDRANALIDKLRGPAAKEKAALIASLEHEVEKPGNKAKGRELFTANCANCHKLDDIGVVVGPELTGMGAHGPAELLGHIIDPNREVDFAFVAWSIETKDDEIYDGIITRENPNMVALANAGGQQEILKSNIKSRRNTGRSLMPEGFEALGAEGLRDLLAFICGSETRFRILDLAPAFTADSRQGMYRAKGPSEERLHLTKRGIVNAHGVPFRIADHTKHPQGYDVAVLKGGGGATSFSRTLPQSVTVKLGTPAKQLHFLSGIAGWGFPATKDPVPVLKVIAHYAGGKTEEHVLKNGVEFADYNKVVEVPGSKLVTGLTERDQLRFFTVALKAAGVIEKIEFASFNNAVAPTIVAVTADQSDAAPPASRAGAAGNAAEKKAEKKGGKKKAAAKNAPAPVAAAAAAPTAAIPSVGPMTWGTGVKALLVGGGSSHDFHRFFNLADVATLKAAGMSANYTESPEDTVRELKNVDVAVLSVNRKEWATPELRKAIFEFVNAGKGLVLVHAGIWYNFKDWPEYNAQIVGGGSRGHDKLGDFSVKVLKDHPITRGVTKTFPITDELYYMTPDPEATPIEVLVETSNSIKFGTPHPSVFIVKNPKARIAAIALGHDARAHDLPDYQKLLINAVNWSAGK